MHQPVNNSFIVCPLISLAKTEPCQFSSV